MLEACERVLERRVHPELLYEGSWADLEKRGRLDEQKEKNRFDSSQPHLRHQSTEKNRNNHLVLQTVSSVRLSHSACRPTRRPQRRPQPAAHAAVGARPLQPPSLRPPQRGSRSCSLPSRRLQRPRRPSSQSTSSTRASLRTPTRPTVARLVRRASSAVPGCWPSSLALADLLLPCFASRRPFDGLPHRDQPDDTVLPPCV